MITINRKGVILLQFLILFHIFMVFFSFVTIGVKLNIQQSTFWPMAIQRVEMEIMIIKEFKRTFENQAYQFLVDGFIIEVYQFEDNWWKVEYSTGLLYICWDVEESIIIKILHVWPE